MAVYTEVPDDELSGRILDATGHIVTWNAGAQRNVGAQLEGMHDSRQFQLPRDARMERAQPAGIAALAADARHAQPFTAPAVSPDTM